MRALGECHAGFGGEYQNHLVKQCYAGFGVITVMLSCVFDVLKSVRASRVKERAFQPC
jgi:hypothetical protein